MEIVYRKEIVTHMKKGQVLTGIVERVDFPNKGVVVTDEGSCVVKNVLPGQKVTFVVQKKRNGRGEGRLLQVEEPSGMERESPCPHFGECGGCLYLSLPYGEQLRIKEQQVKRLLESALAGQEREWIFEGIKKSPVQSGYRNKMEFSFGDEYKDGPLALGMHKRGSFYDIVTTRDCRIVDGDYRRILAFTRDFFEGCSFYHRLRHTGYLRHLLVRKAAGTGEILIALVTSSQEDDGKMQGREMADRPGRWKDGLLELKLDGKITGILHIVNDSVADVVRSDHTEILYVTDYFYEEILGLKFKISVFSFFQTNSLGAEVLYETAREYIGDLNAVGKSLTAETQTGQTRTETESGEEGLEGAEMEEGGADKIVFDLFCGTGTIAQLLAPAANRVIGVEIVEEAVEAARKNAQRNGLDNCEFIAGDVLKVLDEVAEKPDLIVLDPPRDGVHPKALRKIIDYGVERLVYISCKPTSLVRDLEMFLDSGYMVERAVAVDMFPWTAGVETVVLLSKGEIDSKKVRVEFSLEDMDMSGFQKGATYEQIKAYVLKHTGLKVSSLYISQVKRKCGLDVGQNYNLSKKENAKVPQCPPEKEAAIVEALKYFQMLE